MNDIRGSKFCNRGIIVFADDYFTRLQVAIIDDIVEEQNILKLIIVTCVGEVPHTLYGASSHAMNIHHNQIPEHIKDRVLELARFRAMGPGDLR